jgi:hypothetical protein
LKRVVRAVDEDRPIRDAPLLEEIDELVQLLGREEVALPVVRHLEAQRWVPAFEVFLETARERVLVSDAISERRGAAEDKDAHGFRAGRARRPGPSKAAGIRVQGLAAILRVAEEHPGLVLETEQLHLGLLFQEELDPLGRDGAIGRVVDSWPSGRRRRRR